MSPDAPLDFKDDCSCQTCQDYRASLNKISQMPEKLKMDDPLQLVIPSPVGLPFTLTEAVRVVQGHNKKLSNFTTALLESFYIRGRRMADLKGWLVQSGLDPMWVPLLLEMCQEVDQFIIHAHKFVIQRTAEKEKAAKRDAEIEQRRQLAAAGGE
jgi:hypothetical protein